MPLFWPVEGLLVVLRHPRLLVGTLLASLLSGACLVVAAAAIWWWSWPHGPLRTGAWFLHLAACLGKVGAGLLLVWVVVLPLLLAVAVDRTVRAVQQLRGEPALPETSWLGTWMGCLRVAVRLLPLRLLYAALAVVSLFLGPLGLVLGAYGIGHMACLDSLDAGLAARGLRASERLALLRSHRPAVAGAAVVAGVLVALLSPTLIGWLLWMPAVAAGAACEAMRWTASLPRSRLDPSR